MWAQGGNSTDEADEPVEVITADVLRLRATNVCNGDLLRRLALTRNKENFPPMEITSGFAREECPQSQNTCCDSDIWDLLDKVQGERTAALKKSRHILLATGDILRNLVSERRFGIFQKSLDAVKTGTRSCVQNQTFFDRFPEDVEYLREHSVTAIKQGLEYIDEVEKNIRSINCLMCDAPLTPQALRGVPYFNGTSVELDAASIRSLLRTHQKGIKLKLFAGRVHRVAVIMSCLKSIVASSQESELVHRELELKETLALLEAKNFEDEKVLAADTSHMELMAKKEDMWRLHSMREAVRVFSFFVNIVARRLSFDIEITDYINSVYGRTFRMLYNRDNDKCREEFYNITVRYSPSGLALPSRNVQVKRVPILQTALAFWGVILMWWAAG